MAVAIAHRISQKQDKAGMLRRALERLIQLYTDKSHFIYELLQNAEDAGATKIKFQQYADYLVVLHDGRPFTEANLEALYNIGKSDKIGDLNQIGEFGVGFKSVFGICENVRLYSHPAAQDLREDCKPYALEIVDFTRPVDIEDQHVETGYTTKFVFPYKVGLSFSSFKTKNELNEVLAKRLQNLGVTTLLFMKNLQAIDYEIALPTIKATGSYLLDKKVINNHCCLVTAIGETGREEETEELISYLVFSKPVKGIQSGRTIDIAFALTVDDKGKYTFKPTKYPYISVYFPTETESKLQFIVQGPYRTTPNRSSVPADDKDNLELAKQTGQLLRDSIIELRNAGYLDYSLLNILPINEGVFSTSPLFAGMVGITNMMFKDERLLPCNDGKTYASASSVKIARGAELVEIFNDGLLTELINNGENYYWLPTFLTESNEIYKNLYKFLTGTLKVEVIRAIWMRRYFENNREFLKKRSNEWLIKFYNMYSAVRGAFTKDKDNSNMLTAPIIKTTTGDFVAAYRKIDSKKKEGIYIWRGYENATYLPNVFLPSDKSINSKNIAIVDEYLYSQNIHFFSEILDLRTPPDYEMFISAFKKRCENGESFTKSQHIRDIKGLLKYLRNSEYEDEVDSIIKCYLTLLCKKAGQEVYVNPNKEEVFFSDYAEGMSIEEYFKNIATYAYVDSSFYADNDISVDSLRELGVRDKITVLEDLTSGKYYTGYPGGQPHWSTSGEFRWGLSLENLREVLMYISAHPEASDSKAKSSYIFRFLKQNERKLCGDVHIGGQIFPDLKNEYSDILIRVRYDRSKVPQFGEDWWRYGGWNGKWLYTRDYKLVAPNEISKRDLDDTLYGQVEPKSKVYDLLGFLKNEKDCREDIEKDYDKLSKEKKEQYFEIEFFRRYGLSLAEFENRYRFTQDKGRREGTSRYMQDWGFEFPSSKVRNWASLRKHVEEVLCFASPTKYEEKVRRIRVSRPNSEIKAYLTGMYRVYGSAKYACQLCHQPVSDMVMCQLANSPKVELDQMNLCLCPNCAAEYKGMRKDEDELQLFLDSIENLDEEEIESSDPVEVFFDDKSIWFTQTHVAEIRELMKLQAKIYEVEETLELGQEEVGRGASKTYEQESSAGEEGQEQIEPSDSNDEETHADIKREFSESRQSETVHEPVHAKAEGQQRQGETLDSLLKNVLKANQDYSKLCSVAPVMPNENDRKIVQDTFSYWFKANQKSYGFSNIQLMLDSIVKAESFAATHKYSYPWLLAPDYERAKATAEQLQDMDGDFARFSRQAYNRPMVAVGAVRKFLAEELKRKTEAAEEAIMGFSRWLLDNNYSDSDIINICILLTQVETCARNKGWINYEIFTYAYSDALDLATKALQDEQCLAISKAGEFSVRSALKQYQAFLRDELGVEGEDD